ncbi:MAG: helix-turn-helix domain-containing protein [Clostridia bacterium]|nr:helix-turn-helix domain-containing protein [Clostridia bacterium]
MLNARYTLRVPKADAFELKYYYSKEDEPFEARTFPPHIHDVPEIYILEEGTACFAVENRLYRLKAGDILITAPNEMHNCILTEKTVHKHFCLWFEPSCFLLDAILQNCGSEGNLISPPQETKKKILSLCKELYRATEEKKHRREYALLCQILCEIEESIGTGKESDTNLPPILTEILQEIAVNFSKIESLNDLTEKFYISPSTLGRLFRTHLHTSPKSYLETKKLAYSRILLREGRSVTEACTGAGYSDVSGYIRLFRRRFGVTPGEYRKK